MKSLFQKCLKDTFGEKNYLKFVKLCKDEIKDVTADINNSKYFEKNRIYKNMMDVLHDETEESLEAYADNFTSTMHRAFVVGHGFWKIIMFYILANIIILGLDMEYYVTCITLASVGCCFLYKLMEYLSNKYCIVDAYLFMVFKAVLEELNQI